MRDTPRHWCVPVTIMSARWFSAVATIREVGRLKVKIVCVATFRHQLSVSARFVSSFDSTSSSSGLGRR